MLTFRSAFILCLALAASPAHAVTLTGPAKAVDGDTLVLRGQKVRLFGIDAPEHDQSCDRDGQSWACGQWAGSQLARMVKGQPVTCQGREHDKYGRLLAVCHAGGASLNAALVREGAAFAYRRYSDDYVAEERAAQTERRGLWAARVEAPEEFRHETDAPAVVARGAGAPGACLLKGNISAKGERVYHSPGQEHYDDTVISLSKGERWFCSPAEAQAAGWRAARR